MEILDFFCFEKGYESEVIYPIIQSKFVSIGKILN